MTAVRRRTTARGSPTTGPRAVAAYQGVGKGGLCVAANWRAPLPGAVGATGRGLASGWTPLRGDGPPSRPRQARRPPTAAPVAGRATAATAMTPAVTAAAWA